MAPPVQGASVYQLIDAVQFMNVFGRMLDRREPQRAGGGPRRRSRRLDLEGAGDGNATGSGNGTDFYAGSSAGVAFRREAVTLRDAQRHDKPVPDPPDPLAGLTSAAASLCGGAAARFQTMQLF